MSASAEPIVLDEKEEKEPSLQGISDKQILEEYKGLLRETVCARFHLASRQFSVFRSFLQCGRRTRRICTMW